MGVYPRWPDKRKSRQSQNKGRQYVGISPALSEVLDELRAEYRKTPQHGTLDNYQGKEADSNGYATH
jgi:hypothetical protein